MLGLGPLSLLLFIGLAITGLLTGFGAMWVMITNSQLIAVVIAIIVALILIKVLLRR